VTADHRSVHPNIPGIPWWGAVLLAVTATTIGFAYDAGSGAKELSTVFAASYVVGCVVAVLAVRQNGVFTAVIQPPLILFGAVPTAYFLFHGGQITTIKDTLINCGYPLIERFPVMFFTSAAVLLIGMGRWYQGMSTRRAAPRSTTKEATTETKESTGASLISRVSSLFARGSADDDAEADEPPRRRRSIERPGREPKAARGRRPAKRPTPSRSRHARPPETEIIEPVAERPRRPRSPRQSEPPDQPRRRPRASSTNRKAAPPPADRRAAYERTERRRRLDDYERSEPDGANGNGTHHPISRVRYRGDADAAENRPDSRTPRQSRREREAESWEYDI
jgi:hypothetical protein